jgi:hypothetical protein
MSVINQGECPKCGKRVLHVRIEGIIGQADGKDARCLSYCCIHCNAVLAVGLDQRAKPRPRRKAAADTLQG